MEQAVVEKFVKILPDRLDHRQTTLEKSIHAAISASGWKSSEFYSSLLTVHKTPKIPQVLKYTTFVQYLSQLVWQGVHSDGDFKKWTTDFLQSFLSNEKTTDDRVILARGEPEAILNPILWWFVKMDRMDYVQWMINDFYNRLGAKKDVEFYNILLAGTANMCRYGQWNYLDRCIQDMIDNKVNADELTAQLVYRQLPSWELRRDLLPTMFRNNEDTFIDHNCHLPGDELEAFISVWSDRERRSIMSTNMILAQLTCLDKNRALNLLQRAIMDHHFKPDRFTVQIFATMFIRDMHFVSCIKWLYYCQSNFGLNVDAWTAYLANLICSGFSRAKLGEERYRELEINRVLQLLRWMKRGRNEPGASPVSPDDLRINFSAVQVFGAAEIQHEMSSINDLTDLED
ncbi:DEKNAAC101843 [Brettanomyces naardenensis]|uniref:DEKNAAC101843 n=1 Tax=Brettanomyces naardenensis TaxID=13370 RepID=A0A448YJ17_BRENA|nr:DEKNAAC101843 [Brettanomyces naardenensis]